MTKDKPLALRFLELLPPKLLQEVVTYCTLNGNAVNDYVAASRRSHSGLPCAFWAVDAYSNPDHRHQALTALAVHAASLEVAVADEGTLDSKNYWQIVSNRVFGSAQDNEFRKRIALDQYFDFDDAQEYMKDFLTKEQRKAIANSPAYKRASSLLQASLAGNGKFLTMLRNYGEAVAELSARADDIANYYRHYEIVIPNRPEGLFGDVADLNGDFFGDIAFDGDAASEVRYDMMIDNSQNPLQGGFFKKIGKALKKVAKVALPVVGKLVPGVGLAATALGALGGRGKVAPAPVEQPQVMPQWDANQAVPTVADRMAEMWRNRPGQASLPWLSSPEGAALFNRANASEQDRQALLKALGAGSGFPTEIDGNPIIAQVIQDRLTGRPALVYPALTGEVICDSNCGDATREIAMHVVNAHLTGLSPETRNRVIQAMSNYVRSGMQGDVAFEGGVIDDILGVVGKGIDLYKRGKEVISGAPGPAMDPNSPASLPGTRTTPGQVTTAPSKPMSVSDIIQGAGKAVGTAVGTVVKTSADVTRQTLMAPFQFAWGAAKGLIASTSALQMDLSPSFKDPSPGRGLLAQIGSTFQQNANTATGDIFLGDAFPDTTQVTARRGDLSL